MKRPSFRLRIALLSAALAGSALVGFGAVSWFQIYNARVGRLDAELENELMRAVGPRHRQPRDRQRWQFYEDSLAYSFGTKTKIPIALLVLDANGNTVYQSNSVPADLNVNRLLQRRLQLTPLPPPPPGSLPKLESTNPHQRPPFIPPHLPRFVTEHTETEVWRIGAAKSPNVGVALRKT